MDKYIFKLSAAIATFILGVVFSGLWLSDSFSDKTATGVDHILIKQIAIVPPSSVIPRPDVIACGKDSFGNRASFSTYTTADGEKFSSTLVYGLKSEKNAQKRMRQAIKNAVKVIELSPNIDYWQRKIGEKAIVQFKDGFVLVKYERETSKYSDGYNVSIVKTETLKQAVKVDKEQESLKRSEAINKLK